MRSKSEVSKASGTVDLSGLATPHREAARVCRGELGNGEFGRIVTDQDRPQRPGLTELGRPGDPTSPLVVGVTTTRGYNREPSRAWARKADTTIQAMPSGVLRVEFRDPMDPKGKRLWADFEGDEADRLASHIRALRKGSGS